MSDVDTAVLATKALEIALDVMARNGAGAADVRVDVVPLGGALLGGGGGDATHRATVEVRGKRAELDVRWTPGEGGAAGRGVVTAFRRP